MAYSLSFKTNLPLNNDKLNLVYGKYINSEFIPIHGWQFENITSDRNVVTLSIDPENYGFDHDLSELLPIGASFRVEFPENGEFYYLDDVISLDPNKLRQIIKEKGLQTSPNMIIKTKLVENDVTVEFVQGVEGILEVVEVTPKDNPTNIVQRISVNVSASEPSKTVRFENAVNKNDNRVMVRWKSKGYDFYTNYITVGEAIKTTSYSITAHDVEETSITFTAINEDTQGPIYINDIYLKVKNNDREFTLVPKIRHNSDSTSLTLLGEELDRMLSVKGETIVSLYSVTEPLTSNNYTINMDDLISDASTVTLNGKASRVIDTNSSDVKEVRLHFDYTGDRSNPPIINIEKIEINKSDLTFPYRVVKSDSQAALRTDGYYVCTVNDIFRVSYDALLNIRVTYSVKENGKLKAINYGVLEQETPDMTSIVAAYSDSDGILELTTHNEDVDNNKYGINPDIRYRHVTAYNGTNAVVRAFDILGGYPLIKPVGIDFDSGKVDNVKFRWTINGKHWSELQFTDTSSIYNEFANKLVTDKHIKEGDILINETSKVATLVPGRRVPTKLRLIAEKTVTGDRLAIIPFENFDRVNRTYSLGIPNLPDFNVNNYDMEFNWVWEYYYGDASNRVLYRQGPRPSSTPNTPVGPRPDTDPTLAGDKTPAVREIPPEIKVPGKIIFALAGNLFSEDISELSPNRDYSKLYVSEPVVNRDIKESTADDKLAIWEGKCTVELLDTIISKYINLMENSILMHLSDRNKYYDILKVQNKQDLVDLINSMAKRDSNTMGVIYTDGDVLYINFGDPTINTKFTSVCPAKDVPDMTRLATTLSFSYNIPSVGNFSSEDHIITSSSVYKYMLNDVMSGNISVVTTNKIAPHMHGYGSAAYNNSFADVFKDYVNQMVYNGTYLKRLIDKAVANNLVTPSSSNNTLKIGPIGIMSTTFKDIFKDYLETLPDNVYLRTSTSEGTLIRESISLADMFEIISGNAEKLTIYTANYQGDKNLLKEFINDIITDSEFMRDGYDSNDIVFGKSMRSGDIDKSSYKSGKYSSLT